MLTMPRELEPVREGSVYSLPQFLIHTSLTQSAFRAAVHRGLRVSRIGKRVFVDGGDWLAFVRGQAAQPAAE